MPNVLRQFAPRDFVYKVKSLTFATVIFCLTQSRLSHLLCAQESPEGLDFSGGTDSEIRCRSGMVIEIIQSFIDIFVCRNKCLYLLLTFLFHGD